MQYIVIEVFGGAENATIVTNEDGINKVFDDELLAIQEAAECQDGQIVEIFT